MQKQLTWCPDPDAAIVVPPHRAEPSLWVRRLIIWERPGTVIREIRLQRGLNILWAHEESPETGDEGGHGAGKTLFCRLIRYCLGEETFATTDVRAAIAEALPEGVVGAEIVLQGRTWGVIRPLGRRAPRAASGEGSPEDLITSGQHSGMSPVLDVLQALVGTTHASPAHAWLQALAWLTRDQECRLGHLMDWRSPRTDSHSPAAGHGRDERADQVRRLIGISGTVETALRDRIDGLVAARRHKERALAQADQLVQVDGKRLAVLIGADVTLLDAGLAGISALQEQARARVAEARELLDGTDDDDVGAALRERERTCRAQAAALEARAAKYRGLIESEKRHLGAIVGQIQGREADRRRAEHSKLCESCPFSDGRPGPEALEAQLAELVERRHECQALVHDYGTEQEKAVAQAVEFTNEADRLEADLDAHERHSRAKTRELRARYAAAGGVERNVEQLAETLEERAIIRKDLARIADEEVAAREQLEQHRAQHAATVQRQIALFHHVCRGLVAGAPRSKLTLHNSLRAEVGIGGQAGDILSVIAFDLAVMLSSIEGRTHLPAFLVHDSPREADLALPHYYRLFQYVRQLDQDLGAPPPFQYIVTTTTSPPQEMLTMPYLIAKISATGAENRLLRRVFGA